MLICYSYLNGKVFIMLHSVLTFDLLENADSTLNFMCP